jgi:hypothetical protein
MVASKATLAASSDTINRLCASRWQMTKLSNTSPLVSRRLLRQVRASQVIASQVRAKRAKQSRATANTGSRQIPIQ